MLNNSIFGSQKQQRHFFMKPFFSKILLLLACYYASMSAMAQGTAVYTPYSNDSLQLLQVKNSIRQKYQKDSAAITGENKKKILEIYRDRYDFLAGMFTDKEFLWQKNADTYLQALTASIIKNNPPLGSLGTRFLFSRAYWPNAFSCGEGTIVFNIGLFHNLENESQVVFVLCHELAHLYLDHSNNGIRQYVHTVNSKEFQQELKEIKKSKYGVNKQLEQLEKGMAFKNRRHGRAFESEADSMGLVFMRNTGYNLNGALTGLAILDTIDQESYAADKGLQKYFDFPEYPFRKSWLKKEEVFFGGVEDKSISNKERDSLKTHPDCKSRIARLRPEVEKNNTAANKNFLVDEAQFNLLRTHFKYETIEYCYSSGNIGLSLYYALELLESKPDDAYLVTLIGKCFNSFYLNQKNHSLNRVAELPSPYLDKNYDVLLQFLQNINLNNIAALNYYFLNSYRTKLAGNTDFEKELATSTKNFTTQK